MTEAERVAIVKAVAELESIVRDCQHQDTIAEGWALHAGVRALEALKPLLESKPTLTTGTKWAG